MEFGVLGPLRVWVDGQERGLPPKGRVLLGVLLGRANRPVPVEVLIDALWEGRRVENGKQKLQLHVHQARRVLGEAERITHADGAYMLRVHPGELDPERFESSVGQAREAMTGEDPDRSEALAREASGMWRASRTSRAGTAWWCGRRPTGWPVYG